MDGMRGSLRQWRQKNFPWDWCSGVIIYDFLFWVRKSLINSSRWSSVMRLGPYFVVACFYKSFSIKVLPCERWKKRYMTSIFPLVIKMSYSEYYCCYESSVTLYQFCVSAVSATAHVVMVLNLSPTVCPLTPTLSCDVYYKPQPATLVNSWQVTRYI